MQFDGAQRQPATCIVHGRVSLCVKSRKRPPAHLKTTHNHGEPATSNDPIHQSWDPTRTPRTRRLRRRLIERRRRAPRRPVTRARVRTAKLRCAFEHIRPTDSSLRSAAKMTRGVPTDRPSASAAHSAAKFCGTNVFGAGADRASMLSQAQRLISSSWLAAPHSRPSFPWTVGARREFRRLDFTWTSARRPVGGFCGPSEVEGRSM